MKLRTRVARWQIAMFVVSGVASTWGMARGEAEDRAERVKGVLKGLRMSCGDRCEGVHTAVYEGLLEVYVPEIRMMCCDGSFPGIVPLAGYKDDADPRYVRVEDA